MTNSKEWDIVLEMLRQQTFAVLGTSREGHAYTSLVAFSATSSAKTLYFATTRATRKYHNLAVDNRVSLLFDNRADLERPLYEAAAVTAYGAAEEVNDHARSEALQNYLTRHPQLKTFAIAPSTALFRIDVEEYHLVERFQNVTEFRMNR
jgi:nitroimidazol reductase NimA-like FMN-containing flavoprotein (pyridoxamine 5'-phosphate oxidase superfamily)